MNTNKPLSWDSLTAFQQDEFIIKDVALIKHGYVDSDTDMYSLARTIYYNNTAKNDKN